MSEKEGRDDEDGDVGGDKGRGTGIEASRDVYTLGPWHTLFPHCSERYAGQEEASNPDEAFDDDEIHHCIADSLFHGKDTDLDVLE